MIFKKYYINIYIRILLMLLTCLALGWMVAAEVSFLISVHVGLLIILQAWLMIRYTNRWNTELSDFFSRLQANDYMTSTDSLSVFPNLKALEKNLKSLSEKIRIDKIRHETENEYFKILSQKVATGIIVCNDKSDVQFTNSSALHYFGVPAIRNLQNLERHHTGIFNFLKDLKTGNYGSLNIKIGGNEQILMIRASEIVVDRQRLKVYSIEDIEKEIKKHELESWQKLIRIMNHEIMNSISPITSTVNTLADSWKEVKSSDEPEQKLINKTIKGLQIIHERSDGLKNFVEAYRSLTKKADPSFKMIKPGEVIMPILELFEQTVLDSNIKFDIYIPDEQKPIHTDTNLMQQILINLVKNSIESFDESIEHPEIGIRFNQFPHQYNFIIEDNGHGMTEEVLKNATIPFFTTKPEGTGVGLSLVRQLVALLNGEIKLVSKEGEGTKVILNF